MVAMAFATVSYHFILESNNGLVCATGFQGLHPTLPLFENASMILNEKVLQISF